MSVAFLLHLGKHYTVRGYQRSWGKELGPSTRIYTYPGLKPTGPTLRKKLQQRLRARRFRPPAPGELEDGTCRAVVFSDLDRLSNNEQPLAIELYGRLTERAPHLRLLNHPTRSLQRFELLRGLHEQGDNAFDIYRASEQPEPERWPVFLRHEQGHGGMSALLNDRNELDRELERQVARYGDLDRTLMIEHCDVSDPDGVVRKYGAFRVGDVVIARHIHFSRDWLVRFPDIKTSESTQEELAYVRDNPHADRLMEIFRFAGIEYGRIDYGLRDGHIQVWEINTNPMILVPEDTEDPLRFEAHDTFARAFASALDTIARS